MVDAGKINVPLSSYDVNKKCCEDDGRIWMSKSVLREYLLITNGGNTILVDNTIQDMEKNGLFYPEAQDSEVYGACFEQVGTKKEPPPDIEGCFDNGNTHDEIPPLKSGTVTPLYPDYPASNYGSDLTANVHNASLCEWPEGCADDRFDNYNHEVPPFAPYMNNDLCFKVGCMDNGVSGRYDESPTPILIIPKYGDETPLIPAINYDPVATRHDPSLCQYGELIVGCMDRGILGEDDVDDNPIQIIMAGIENPNYDSTAQIHDPSMCCDPEASSLQWQFLGGTNPADCEGCHDPAANNYVGANMITKIYPCPDDNFDGKPDCCTYDPLEDYGYTCFETPEMIWCYAITQAQAPAMLQNGRILYLTSAFGGDPVAAFNACQNDKDENCGDPLPDDSGYICEIQDKMGNIVPGGFCKEVLNGAVYTVSQYGSLQAALDKCKEEGCGKKRPPPPTRTDGYSCIEDEDGNKRCVKVSKNAQFLASAYNNSMQDAKLACLETECEGCPCEDGTYSPECCEPTGCPCEDGTYSQECCGCPCGTNPETYSEECCPGNGCPCGTNPETYSEECCPDTSGYNCVPITNYFGTRHLCQPAQTNATYRSEDHGGAAGALTACENDLMSPCKKIRLIITGCMKCNDPDACNEGDCLPCKYPAKIKIVPENDTVYDLDVIVSYPGGTIDNYFIYDEDDMWYTDGHILSNITGVDANGDNTYEPKTYAAGTYIISVYDGSDEDCLYTETIVVPECSDPGAIVEIAINHNCPKISTTIYTCIDPTACNYGVLCAQGVTECCDYGHKIIVRFPASQGQESGGRVLASFGQSPQYTQNSAILNVDIDIFDVTPPTIGTFGVAQSAQAVDGITLYQHNPESTQPLAIGSRRGDSQGFSDPPGDTSPEGVWYNAQVNSKPFCPGTYNVVVTDDTGCIYDEVVVITNQDEYVDVYVDCSGRDRPPWKSGGIKCTGTPNWNCTSVDGKNENEATWEYWDYMSDIEKSKSDQYNFLSFNTVPADGSGTWVRCLLGGGHACPDHSTMSSCPSYMEAYDKCNSVCKAPPPDPCNSYPQYNYIRPSHGDYFFIQKHDTVGDIQTPMVTDEGDNVPINYGVGKGNPADANQVNSVIHLYGRRNNSNKIRVKNNGAFKGTTTLDWRRPVQNILHHHYHVFVFYEFGWSEHILYTNSKGYTYSHNPHIRPTGWYKMNPQGGRLDIYGMDHGNSNRHYFPHWGVYDDYTPEGTSKAPEPSWTITQFYPPRGTQIFGAGYNTFNAGESSYNVGTPISGPRGPKTNVGGTNGDPCCWSEGNYGILWGNYYGKYLGRWDFTRRNPSGTGCAPNNMDTLRFAPTAQANEARAYAESFDYANTPLSLVGLSADGDEVIDYTLLLRSEALPNLPGDGTRQTSHILTGVSQPKTMGWSFITNTKTWYENGKCSDNNNLAHSGGDTTCGTFWVGGAINTSWR